MLVGLLFAVLAALCGLAVNRALRGPLSLAPFSGLASIAVLTAWCAATGAPPLVSSGLLVGLTVVGIIAGRPLIEQAVKEAKNDRVTVAILAAAVAIPWLLLGIALMGIDAPVSTHDGAFHVESIDNLRHGVPIQGWYPMAFHSSVAAVLRLLPWLDTARGTLEAAQALAMLAPLGVFALGIALGLGRRIASIGALVLALTYIYPYDDHMWGGYPLASSLLLLLGLWSVAIRWVMRPSAGMAALGGLLAGVIVLTHGTEVYSAIVGLAVIAAFNVRRLNFRALARQAPLALVVAVVCTLPYLQVLLGWAAGGGASVAALDELSTQTRAGAGADWVEFILGVTGAGSLLDLPLRAALLILGARNRHLWAVLAAWAVFAIILFAVSFIDVPPIRWLYVVTFPWLVHHRPPQVLALFASLLVSAGLVSVAGWAWSARVRMAGYPNAWRRLAIVGGALLLFFFEGSVVSIFKTLDAVIADQNVYLADDRAAMAWLRQHALPGEMVVNDLASDAGIWAPYKAGVAVLLPRSAPGALVGERSGILNHVTDLGESAVTAQQACALHADYLYQGSRTFEDDTPMIPDRAALENAPGLEEVFASGGATVYRIHLPCDARGHLASQI